MNTHATDKLLVYRRVFCLNLTRFNIVHFLETQTSPSWGKKSGKDPVRLLLTQSTKHLAIFCYCLWHRCSNICAKKPWCLRVHTGCGSTHRSTTTGALTDSRAASGTNGAVRSQIYFCFLKFLFTEKHNNLLTSSSPNGLMLIWSSSIKCKKIRLR